MVPVVTACNQAYLPGVQALYNSFKRYCSPNDFYFVVLLEGGDPSLLIDQGMVVHHNPKLGIDRVRGTRNRPENTKEVHALRLLIPDLLPDKAIYIDADAIITKPLNEIASLKFSEPVAACRNWASLAKDVEGAPDVEGFINSLVIFNGPAWREQGIFKKCKDLMETSNLVFNTGEQGVMNIALMRNWHKLPDEIQSHVGHNTYSDKTCVLHFLGTNPWDEIPAHLLPYPDYKLKARELWSTYYRG